MLTDAEMVNAARQRSKRLAEHLMQRTRQLKEAREALRLFGEAFEAYCESADGPNVTETATRWGILCDACGVARRVLGLEP